MSEPRLISPLLDGFALGGPISSHSGVRCYPAMRSDSDERFIVKTISIPVSQVQVDALLLTGAYPNAEAAAAYFRDLAEGIGNEVEILKKLADKRGFLAYLDQQIVPMEQGVGYEVYLLSHYLPTLERQLKRGPLTHLSAVNLGIDLCAAMAVCRSEGYLYVDLKPENIILPGHQEYRIGDLGFVPLNSLKYASLPDRYRSLYTPPEITDAYSTLNETMDTFALGLVLYQVYNNGSLPFRSEEDRKALYEKMAAGEPMPAPVYADYEMAQIIAKACAFRPADRWQTPSEMGHALIAYMQRNGANDVPILPTVADEPEIPEEEIPEPEEILPETEAPIEAPAEPENEPSAEAPEEEAEEPAEASVEASEPEAPAEETEAEAEPEAPAEALQPDEEAAEPTEPEEEAQPEADWIDRMDAILAEDQPEDQPSDPEEPSLRELLDTDAESTPAEDENWNMTQETADILTQAQELIEHETPEPVVAPEPILVTLPEQSEPEQEAEAEDASAPVEEPEAVPEQPAPPKPQRKWVKRLIRTVTGLLLAAVLAAAAYYYYNEIFLQKIDSFSIGGHGTQITAMVQTDMDTDLLTVICQDTYGNAQRGRLENGKVVFTDLLPGTQYIVMLEVDGFHKLVGSYTPAAYSTPNSTQLINLAAVTGQTDGSAIISFGVEGVDTENWSVLCTAEGEDDRTIPFTGHTVTIEELTVGKEYTFTLSGGEGIYLIGEYSVRHTASALVLAEDLMVSGYNEGTITASWSVPEGATVDRWIARCYNDDGYNQVLEVTEPSATFTEITLDTTYTVEITAANMTMGTRTFVTANPVTVHSVKAQYNRDAGQIQVSWTFDGGTPEGGWVVLYTVDHCADQQVINTVESSAVITPVVPDSTYTITILTANSSSVFGSNIAKVDVRESRVFNANRLNPNNVMVSLHQIPENEGWTYAELKDADKVNTFAPGDGMAVMYRTSKSYSASKADFVSVFVIRDAAGNVVSFSTRTRTWNSMWKNGYCVETISQLPTEPGEYMLDIYLNNTKLTRQSFTVQ